jgi:CheY-like chemotaxis protein
MGKGKILVIDDEKDILEIAKKRLESHGYEVLVARSGREGIEKAITAKPELIFLDLMMPEIDGFQVCHLLQQSDQTKAIPIIAFTALTEQENIKKILNLGAKGYVLKPFKSSDLLKFTQHFLKKGQSL